MFRWQISLSYLEGKGERMQSENHCLRSRRPSVHTQSSLPPPLLHTLSPLVRRQSTGRDASKAEERGQIFNPFFEICQILLLCNAAVT